MQVEVERIDVGDPQAVGDEAAGRRAAARADRDALLARVADEVPDDQEVPRVLHLLDHVDLVREPRLVLGRSACRSGPRAASCRRRGSRAAKPSRTTCSKYVVEREARRHVEVRQVVPVPDSSVDVAALGDAHRVRQRLGIVAEDRRHLLGRLQEELVAVVAQPLRVVDGLAGADAEQDVVRLLVGLRR